MDRAGVYLHTPFCRSRCSYCDFATGMYESDVAARYVLALRKEIGLWNEIVSPRVVDTIYFGGGTPSLLSIDQIERILIAVRERFKVAEDAEVTLEINPGDGGTSAASKRIGFSLDAALVPRGSKSEFFPSLGDLGINRASFGAQTFDGRELKMLGRTHDSADLRTTFQLLREAGFDNVNFALLAGVPGQTIDGWKRKLE